MKYLAFNIFRTSFTVAADPENFLRSPTRERFHVINIQSVQLSDFFFLYIHTYT